jgi:hypothetical protein
MRSTIGWAMRVQGMKQETVELARHSDARYRGTDIA